MLRGVCGAALALAVGFAPAAVADPAAATNSTATLTVVYEVRGSGNFNSNDKVIKREWTVLDNYTIRANYKAKAPSGFPAFHKQDLAQQDQNARQVAAANQAAQDMAPMMANAMQIMEKCGDDEDCITRETMKMAQGVDMNSATMKSAKSNMATAMTMPKDRYQIFEPTGMTGDFSIAETEKVLDRDPICHDRPLGTCTIDYMVAGKGAIKLDGKTNLPGGNPLEIDLQGNTLAFKLPLPYPVSAKATLKSDHPEDKPGVTDEMRFLTNLQLPLDIEHACGGSCKNASGSKVFDIVDQLEGDPAKLKVTWTFTRK